MRRLNSCCERRCTTPAGCQRISCRTQNPRDRNRRPDVERRSELAALHRNFVLPAGLRLSRPREVTLSAGGRFVLGLAVLLFAAAIAVAIGMTMQILQKDADNRIITTTGVDTVGTVVRL